MNLFLIINEVFGLVAMQPYGLNSSVTKLLSTLLQSDLYFIILSIVMCSFVVINIVIIIIYLFFTG